MSSTTVSLFDLCNLFFDSIGRLLSCCEISPYDGCQPYQEGQFIRLLLQIPHFVVAFELINLLFIVKRIIGSSETEMQRLFSNVGVLMAFIWIYMCPMEPSSISILLFVIHKLNTFLVYLFVNAYSPLMKKVLLSLSLISFIGSFLSL